MNNNEILVVEISGKRPGGVKRRPTEKFSIGYDKVIISNNSEGYKTDWEIFNVPDDYREWYIRNVKNSENAWYAPMNRSYAIKYAREHGYKYLVQLDDNINSLEISYYDNRDVIKKRLRQVSSKEMMDDFILMQKTVLDNTNAAMVGFSLRNIAMPNMIFMREGYVYSFFMLNLEKCPDIFHGDFEDDIEYRLKCSQMGLPVVQINTLKYSKTGQQHTKDLSGCRAEYLKAGIKRGEHMTKLYGDLYKCKMTRFRHGTILKPSEQPINFKHILKPFKLGVIVYDMNPIKSCMRNILKKYGTHHEDKYVIKERKPRR